ncbi:hypothetical protein HL658_09835 [Azospirillum sp. RWY-5-1]|uniref:Ner winged helix-turn-helix DNA-binding domain-containing protein n=1 Tax=Azospirillum oleiclasticum TaxID=2735135 RepID=A0ABX2T6R0_9PROT|nr:helix-turn-helix domain-containing protein [Azospirillum oleiclasticum]NYZ12852.1 hypothetical protein [Azospirillum oleiclasticum]NYZ20012.1 hypothetical protein [Azospirillum oleiclasticum]
MQIPKFQTPREREIWVQAALKLRGKSMARIARDKGWTRNAIYRAFEAPSFPQEQAIADALGVTPMDIFPERYGPDGERLHLIRPRKTTQAHRNGNV